MKTRKTAVSFAILAAALYAVNIPFSKLLLGQVPPTMMAAFLYLGAGAGLFLWGLVSGSRTPRQPVASRELPYLLGMILLDIAAPILLMLGLNHSNAASASLLNNFEIVATSLIAYFLFREQISRLLASAILLVTIASIVLSWEGAGSLSFSGGSLLVLAAAACWGLENNCTRMLSHRSSVETTTIKGLFSGFGSLLVAFLRGESLPGALSLLLVMLLGFVSYGLSINFYIKAQNGLGAARTSAYYSIAPFLGVLFGILILGERPSGAFYPALAVMALATLLMVRDSFQTQSPKEETP